MIKKLRWRVVAITMTSVFIVLLLLMGALNIANYIRTDNAIDNMLEFLKENGGTFSVFGNGHMGHGGMPDGGMPDGGMPDGGMPVNENVPGGPGQGMIPDVNQNAEGENADKQYEKSLRPWMSEETPYETRFFSVTLNAEGQLDYLDTARIAAVSSEDALEMAQAVADSQADKGYISRDGSRYKYLVNDNGTGSGTESEGSTMYIFVDCTRDMASVKSFLLISILVSLGGFIAIGALVIALSPRMIKPIAESYAKQKEFITNAGHELKTPMAVIESCTEVIEMESGASKWTSGIKDQVRKLAELTGDLVSLARMEEGAGEMIMTQVNLSDLTEESLKGFELKAEQQGMNIVKNIQPDIVINGNSQSLEELVSILADNALKYAVPESEIVFTLSKQGRKTVLTEENISDGLMPGDQSIFFDRFYRGDTSHSSEKEGYGIGLSLAQSIVQAHGGAISASSPDGKRFLITAKF